MPGQPDDVGTTCSQCGSTLPSYTRYCGTCGHTVRLRGGAVLSHPARTSFAQTAQTAVPHPPEPVDVTPAGRGVRCATALLDLAAMLSPALPLSIAAAVLGVSAVVYVVVPVAFVAVWLWMQIWQGLTGTTFGKAMLGLRLVRTSDNNPPGVAHTVLRSLIFVASFGLAAVPLAIDPTTQNGLHDRMTGLGVLDVTVGANPLGPRQQTPLRRAAGRGLNRIHSPVPVAAPRRG